MLWTFAPLLHWFTICSMRRWFGVIVKRKSAITTRASLLFPKSFNCVFLSHLCLEILEKRKAKWQCSENSCCHFVDPTLRYRTPQKYTVFVHDAWLNTQQRTSNYWYIRSHGVFSIAVMPVTLTPRCDDTPIIIHHLRQYDSVLFAQSHATWLCQPTRVPVKRCVMYLLVSASGRGDVVWYRSWEEIPNAYAGRVQCYGVQYR